MALDSLLAAWPAMSLSTEAGRAVLSRTVVLASLLIIPGVAAFILVRLVVGVILRRLIKVKLSTPSIRSVIVSITVLVCYALAIPYAFLIEPDWVRTSRFEMTSAVLKDNEAVVIAHLSDIHWDKGTQKRARRAVALVRRAHPDLIVLTGDYVNQWAKLNYQGVHRFAKDLASIAPVYAVSGNWDDEGVKAALKSAGVRFLENEAAENAAGLKAVRIIGMHYAGATALQRLLNQRQGSLDIVLSHTPDMFESASKLGAELYLCGHTHGGQVRLPVYGTICLEYPLIGKYQAGIYRLKDTTMYISRGLGMEGGAPGIRFCCWPEVSVITVKGSPGLDRASTKGD